MKIYSNVSFDGLKINISDLYNQMTYIEIWQIGDNVDHYMTTLILPKNMNMGELFNKLNKDFNAILSYKKINKQMYPIAKIYEKKEEVFDWINSIELINKLVGDI